MYFANRGQWENCAIRSSPIRFSFSFFFFSFFFFFFSIIQYTQIRCRIEFKNFRATYVNGNGEIPRVKEARCSWTDSIHLSLMTCIFNDLTTRANLYGKIHRGKGLLNNILKQFWWGKIRIFKIISKRFCPGKMKFLNFDKMKNVYELC